MSLDAAPAQLTRARLVCSPAEPLAAGLYLAVDPSVRVACFVRPDGTDGADLDAPKACACGSCGGDVVRVARHALPMLPPVAEPRVARPVAASAPRPRRRFIAPRAERRPTPRRDPDALVELVLEAPSADGFEHELAPEAPAPVTPLVRPPAPVTRAGCADLPKPCVADCRYRIDGARPGCALDFVDAHPDGATLEQVAAVFGVTRERIRQMEAGILRKLVRRARALGLERAFEAFKTYE